MGRIMQWNTNNMFKLSILLSFTLFLFLLPAPVHGTSLELLHRHHDRFTGGELDRVEAFKGFVQRDSVRRLQINQRLGISADYDNRRKATETEPSEVEMPLLTGRDMGIGEYFVEVKVGSPGQRVWLAADTGSEFTWFNAVMKQKNETPHKRHKKKRARRAKKHHHKGSKKHSKKKSKSHKKSDPCNGVFCPHKSQSFKSVTCSSRKCKVDLSELFSLTSCPNPSDPCLYDIRFRRIPLLLVSSRHHGQSHVYIFLSDLEFYYNNMHCCLMNVLWWREIVTLITNQQCNDVICSCKFSSFIDWVG